MEVSEAFYNIFYRIDYFTVVGTKMCILLALFICLDFTLFFLITIISGNWHRGAGPPYLPVHLGCEMRTERVS